MADDGTIAARLFVEVGARGIKETAAGLSSMNASIANSHYFGTSLPTLGPLAGGVGSGGESIIDSWFEGMARAFDTSNAVDNMMGAVDQALRGAIGTPALDAQFAVVGGTAGGQVTYNKTVNVYVEGKPLDGDVDELVRVIQGADAVSDWADE